MTVGFDKVVDHLKKGGSVRHKMVTYIPQKSCEDLFYITDSNSTGFIRSVNVKYIMDNEWELLPIQEADKVYHG